MATTSPLAAIRENCLECNGNALEVKLCPCTSCPMYPFRFGKNPYSKRTLTQEQREAASTRLKLARDKKGSSNDSI